MDSPLKYPISNTGDRLSLDAARGTSSQRNRTPKLLAGASLPSSPPESGLPKELGLDRLYLTAWKGLPAPVCKKEDCVQQNDGGEPSE
jgi:hypothetical protein